MNWKMHSIKHRKIPDKIDDDEEYDEDFERE